MSEATETKRVPVCKSAIVDGALTMSFSNGTTVTANAGDISASGVDNLLESLAMMGLAAALRTAYSNVREDAEKAAEAAKAKLASILEFGLDGAPSDGTSSASATMLDIAIAVLAELKGRTEAEIRAVVDGYTDSTDANGVAITAEEKRKALVAKVKNDPATAGLFAMKRAAAKAPKRKAAPSILDAF